MLIAKNVAIWVTPCFAVQVGKNEPSYFLNSNFNPSNLAKDVPGNNISEQNGMGLTTSPLADMIVTTSDSEEKNVPNTDAEAKPRDHIFQAEPGCHVAMAFETESRTGEEMLPDIPGNVGGKQHSDKNIFMLEHENPASSSLLEVHADASPVSKTDDLKEIELGNIQAIDSQGESISEQNVSGLTTSPLTDMAGNDTKPSAEDIIMNDRGSGIDFATANPVIFSELSNEVGQEIVNIHGPSSSDDERNSDKTVSCGAAAKVGACGLIAAAIGASVALTIPESSDDKVSSSCGQNVVVTNVSQVNECEVIGGDITVDNSLEGELILQEYFPNLNTVKGNVNLFGTQLTGFKFSNTETNSLSRKILNTHGHASVLGSIRIKFNEMLTQVVFNGLDNVGGNIDVETNAELITICLSPGGVKVGVGGNIHIKENEKLNTIDFGGITSIGEHFDVEGNEDLTTINANNLEYTRAISISPPVTDVELADAVQEYVQVCTELQISSDRDCVCVYTHADTNEVSSQPCIITPEVLCAREGNKDTQYFCEFYDQWYLAPPTRQNRKCIISDSRGSRDCSCLESGSNGRSEIKDIQHRVCVLGECDYFCSEGIRNGWCDDKETFCFWNGIANCDTNYEQTCIHRLCDPFCQWPTLGYPRTESPTSFPTDSPTQVPSESPTESPTEPPTQRPSESPTESPTIFNITTRVSLWLADRESAEAAYGDIAYWDTSGVTSLHQVFQGADDFNEHISMWDVSDVSDASFMFHGATNFNQDLSMWDVSNIISMDSMFNNATSFNGDLSIWDVSKTTSMDSMFDKATSFNHDLSMWDVSKIISMDSMFDQATSFNHELSNWDVSSLTSSNFMFRDATNFNEDLSMWDVSKITSMDSMFATDWNKFNWNFRFNPDLSTWDVSAVTSMESMFYFARNFNQDLTTWDVSAVTNMKEMFQGAYNFNQDLSMWDVSKITSMDSMFKYARWFNGDLSTWDVSAVISMESMFSGDPEAGIYNQDLSMWDVSKVTNMATMFQDEYFLWEDFDLTTWDVSSVTSMEGMFDGAPHFDQDLSPWDVSAVTNMESMFRGAGSLGFFRDDLLLWDVSAVTTMGFMFHDAVNFNLDLSFWDVSAVTNMESMFRNTASFDQDLSSWDVSKVTSMNRMFYLATRFDQGLSPWDVSKVTNVWGVFYLCPAQEIPLCGQWQHNPAAQIADQRGGLTLATNCTTQYNHFTKI